LRYGGYELCLEEFILNYYLVIKKDNRLRQFIILHLTKLINAVQNMIEIQLLTKMEKFKISNETDNELESLQQKLAEKETELLQVNPEKLAEDNTDAIIKSDDLAQMRSEILDDLKTSNPELERENWM
jgi:hypothetical protein